ncbi:lytic transglycosylase domain-containing protein [Pandoraea sp. NPDC087047]|uniref:lytic transglycosylase domain-containing protein n=1 Tax=Pandoraea sp. NPDC087047 TaxID=3364390 RepID=UPI0038087750
MLCASRPALADCFDDAAAYHHVNADVLRAIAWEESNNRPDARRTNTNGSVDYGLMQINSVHLETLARFGIGTADLMVPCKSVYIAAWHLQRQMAKYGNTWAAIGAYHSATPALRDAYAARIATKLNAIKDARENPR